MSPVLLKKRLARDRLRNQSSIVRRDVPDTVRRRSHVWPDRNWAGATQLGRDVLDDSANGRTARVTAFLNVELFRVMYDRYKANVLPPPPAIERQVAQLGVSPKQTERARQTFMKSAQYAGFIDASSGRFVKPGIAAKEEATQHNADDGKKRGSGSGGNENPPDIDPIIEGLLKRLPKSGDVWPEDDRKLWLQLLEGSFKLIYKDKAAAN
jgi:hypothetical protein